MHLSCDSADSKKFIPAKETDDVFKIVRLPTEDGLDEAVVKAAQIGDMCASIAYQKTSLGVRVLAESHEECGKTILGDEFATTSAMRIFEGGKVPYWAEAEHVCLALRTEKKWDAQFV